MVCWLQVPSAPSVLSPQVSLSCTCLSLSLSLSQLYLSLSLSLSCTCLSLCLSLSVVPVCLSGVHVPVCLSVGVLVAGAFGSFCTESTGFSQLYLSLSQSLSLSVVPVSLSLSFSLSCTCLSLCLSLSVVPVCLSGVHVPVSLSVVHVPVCLSGVHVPVCLSVGVLVAGAFSSFCTESTGFSQLFPGLTPHLLMLPFWFRVPLFREYIMCGGLVSSSKSSLGHLVSRPEGGNVAVLAVGGAPEALDARPGALTLQILNRKGFIKLALKHGAQLVPVFSFGENELFDQMENPTGSALRRLQNRLQSIMGVALPLFHARGVFQYSFGLMPYRQPIHTIVGSPISVSLTPSPDSSDISRLHKLYLQSLTDLFEQNKLKYGLKEDQHLTFI
ncbi:2-acylglycerol O-acyltransferase 2-A-like isoform X1 [Sphaeramia orbicularis]|uniref:2-acylglycerol O-acyltransferase 2-A-like isoform X1 n=1 Tax=Sphaeramia orbicularis TaxID=375764 RepID=UPI00117E3851|nr:2-acylglycerol O-acyltransferase 2-A-like isoform X1 [Sphaeramia orbicularis]